MYDVLSLPSGAAVPQPLTLLSAFFTEEWAYYDGVSDPSPESIEPIDVIVTVSVNSFLNSAGRIRDVHRGLAEACDPLLLNILVEADLRSSSVDVVVELFDVACQVKWMLVPVAAKVLHRKRRSLIPMLDTVLSDYYLQATDRLDLRSAREDKRRAAEAARIPLDAFRNDLLDAWDGISRLKTELEAQGWLVTELRILEVLVWIWADPLRQYLGLIDNGTS